VLMPLGQVIYPYPVLLKYLTHFTFYTELFIPVLLFIPVYTTFFRFLFVGILAGFHVGISLTLFVGLFYLINFASLAGLIPSIGMDWFDRKVVPAFSRIYLRLQQLKTHLRSPVSVAFKIKLSYPTAWSEWLVPLQEGVVLFFLAYVIWWNLDVAVMHGRLMNDKSRTLGSLLRIDQYWGMFAPAVFKDDGWYVLEGTTTQKQQIDLNQKGRRLNYTKPASVMALFKNDRWRKYSENYLFTYNEFMRPYYCNYLLRVWNEDHPNNPVTQLEVIYMKEISLPDYQFSPPTREVLCTCGI